MSHQPAKHKFAKYEPGSTFIGTNQAPFMSRTWFGLNSFMQQQALTMIFLDDMSSQPVCRTQRQLSNCLGAKLPWRNATICSSPKDGKHMRLMSCGQKVPLPPFFMGTVSLKLHQMNEFVFTSSESFGWQSFFRAFR